MFTYAGSFLIEGLRGLYDRLGYLKTLQTGSTLRIFEHAFSLPFLTGTVVPVILTAWVVGMGHSQGALCPSDLCPTTCTRCACVCDVLC